MNPQLSVQRKSLSFGFLLMGFSFAVTQSLLIREFQVLVLGYVSPSATFAGRPIDDFAASFVSPVVLVGPQHRQQLRFNSQAALIGDKLDVTRDHGSPAEHTSNSIG